MTTIEDTQTWERLRGDLAAAAAGVQPEQGCPVTETIWEAAHGELASGELRELIDHVAVCPACADVWRMTHELEQAWQEEINNSRPEVSAPRLRVLHFPLPIAVAMPAPRYRWPDMAAAAALLIAMAGIVGPMARLGGPDAPLVGSHRSGAVEITTSIPKDATLPRTDFRLAWTGPAAGDVRYHLRVSWLGQEFVTLVDVPDLAESEYRVPASKLERVPAGARLYWEVSGYRGDQQLGAKTFITILE